LSSEGPRPIHVISCDRWEVIAQLCGHSPGHVLDIGCRGKELAEHLPAAQAYTGLDITPPADIVADADDRLPLADSSFDTVVLADVLEHLNHPHEAFDEAMRVARRAVVVLLPNMYSLLTRFRYMKGQMSAKYDFTPDPVMDRHRWLPRFDQSRRFVCVRASRAGWRVTEEYGFDGGFRRVSARAAYRLARAIGGPNLWAWEYVARVEPGAGQ
jgi:SAM-dependent methyltransferase